MCSAPEPYAQKSHNASARAVDVQETSQTTNNERRTIMINETNDLSVLDAEIFDGEMTAMTDADLALIMGGAYNVYDGGNANANGWDLRGDSSGGGTVRDPITMSEMSDTVGVATGVGVAAGGVTGAVLGSAAGPAGALAGAKAGAETGALIGAGLGTIVAVGYEIGEYYAPEINFVIDTAGEAISSFIDYVGEVQATTDRQ
jgi:hypothetical protein